MRLPGLLLAVSLSFILTPGGSLLVIFLKQNSQAFPLGCTRVSRRFLLRGDQIVYASGARVCFSALPDASTIMNPEEISSGIFGGADSGSFAVGWAAGSALNSGGEDLEISQKKYCTPWVLFCTFIFSIF